MRKKKKGLLREWVEAVFVALALVIFLRVFFFQIYKIPTGSMVPTLRPGDKIFVSKINYGAKMPFGGFRLPGFRKPQRGEIIVFIPPQEVEQPWYKRKPYIKRLVGLPGETIQIKRGSIYIDGQELVDPEIALFDYHNKGRYLQGKDEVVIPEDGYFFLGDNSANSKDSRYWGPVDKEQVIGKAIFIWWPFGRIGMIE